MGTAGLLSSSMADTALFHSIAKASKSRKDCDPLARAYVIHISPNLVRSYAVLTGMAGTCTPCMFARAAADCVSSGSGTASPSFSCPSNSVSSSDSTPPPPSGTLRTNPLRSPVSLYALVYTRGGDECVGEVCIVEYERETWGSTGILLAPRRATRGLTRR